MRLAGKVAGVSGTSVSDPLDTEGWHRIMAINAMRILTKALAVKYGPDGIRVNSVHPGYMPPMLTTAKDHGPFRDRQVRATPLRRLGKAIEVAYGVLFLASDEASFITGTGLVIDGGFLAR